MPSRSEDRSLNTVYRLCSNTSSFMKVFGFEIQTFIVFMHWLLSHALCIRGRERVWDICHVLDTCTCGPWWLPEELPVCCVALVWRKLSARGKGKAITQNLPLHVANETSRKTLPAGIIIKADAKFSMLFLEPLLDAYVCKRKLNFSREMIKETLC